MFGRFLPKAAEKGDGGGKPQDKQRGKAEKVDTGRKEQDKQKGKAEKRDPGETSTKPTSTPKGTNAAKQDDKQPKKPAPTKATANKPTTPRPLKSKESKESKESKDSSEEAPGPSTPKKSPRPKKKPQIEDPLPEEPPPLLAPAPHGAPSRSQGSEGTKAAARAPSKTEADADKAKKLKKGSKAEGSPSSGEGAMAQPKAARGINTATAAATPAAAGPPPRNSTRGRNSPKNSKEHQIPIGSVEKRSSSSTSNSLGELQVPEEFVCPLSLEVMFDPVIVSSGQTYERVFIVRWMHDGHTTCPKTRQPLDEHSIFPNLVLKMMIEDWCREHNAPLPTPPTIEAAEDDTSKLAQAAQHADAAQARIMALESQRRQRELMEQMAAQRGITPNVGRPSANRHRLYSTNSRSSSTGVPPPIPETGADPNVDRPLPELMLSNMPSFSNTSSAHGTAGTPGTSGTLGIPWGVPQTPTTPGTPGLYRNSSMGSSNRSVVLDSASWPGPLAMQAAIFQRVKAQREASLTHSLEAGGGASEAQREASLTDSLEAGGGGSEAFTTDSLTGSTSGLASRASEANEPPTPGSSSSVGGTSSGHIALPSDSRTSDSLTPRLNSPGPGRLNRPDSGRFSRAMSEASSVTELRMPEIGELVDALKSDAVEEQAAAVALLRVMTRYGAKQARKVSQSDAIPALVNLTQSEDEPTAEHAVTTLLNLCLIQELKPNVHKEENVIPFLVNVVKGGMPLARGNAAAALYLLSTIEGVREEIPKQKGAVPALVRILEEGNTLAKKDAANCILSLCLAKDNRKEIAEAGVVKILCGLLQEGEESVEEQTSAICASLVRDPEARSIMFQEGAITLLAELLEVGATMRCREYAVNSLLGLAVHSKECLAAIDEEGITASIDVLTRTGAPKAQQKAMALLELLRRLGDNE